MEHAVGFHQPAWLRVDQFEHAAPGHRRQGVLDLRRANREGDARSCGVHKRRVGRDGHVLDERPRADELNRDTPGNGRSHLEKR